VAWQFRSAAWRQPSCEGSFPRATAKNDSQILRRVTGAGCLEQRLGSVNRSTLMVVHRRLQLSQVGDVTVVRFVDRKILDEVNIQEMGQELFHLIDDDDHKNLLLNFSSVEFLSSAALGKLITLDKKVKAHGGKLKLSNIRPEIYEVFAITKLTKLFDIKDDEADALASF
jgi:anti-anti-sigma factor